MRRKDRECNEPEFLQEVLNGAEAMFVALMDGEYPYCLPVNFALADGKIYFHSALAGHKLDCVRSNPHVAFSAAIDMEVDQAKSTTYYKSVCGRGLASIVEDEAEKGLALDTIATRYKARCQKPAPPKDICRVAIVRIDVESMTGKRRLKPEPQGQKP